MSAGSAEGLSTLEYHVLLALAGGPRYGYAITEAVETESSHTLRPKAGSLYRVIARLISWGLTVEAEPPIGTPPHPGRTRRYYALTARGREALAAETRRMKQAAALADERLGVAEGS